MSSQAAPFEIRKNGPDDLPRLLQIDQICFPPDIAYSRVELLSYLRHPKSISRVAEHANTILGFVVGQTGPDCSGHVLTLDVIPAARRRGVGTALMKTLHHEFEISGVRAIYLEVDTTNMSAQRFYEGLNYARMEILKGYYNGTSDAYRMVRVEESG